MWPNVSRPAFCFLAAVSERSGLALVTSLNVEPVAVRRLGVYG